jgi:hypothetical protein
MSRVVLTPRINVRIDPSCDGQCARADVHVRPAGRRGVDRPDEAPRRQRPRRSAQDRCRNRSGGLNGGLNGEHCVILPDLLDIGVRVPKSPDRPRSAPQIGRRVGTDTVIAWIGTRGCFGPPRSAQRRSRMPSTTPTTRRRGPLGAGARARPSGAPPRRRNRQADCHAGRSGPDVIAVEPDPAMLSELRLALPAVHALPGSAEAIPLPDASVGALLAENARAPRSQAGTFPTWAWPPGSARPSRPSSRAGSAATLTRSSRESRPAACAGHAEQERAATLGRIRAHLASRPETTSRPVHPPDADRRTARPAPVIASLSTRTPAFGVNYAWTQSIPERPLPLPLDIVRLTGHTHRNRTSGRALRRPAGRRPHVVPAARWSDW